MINVNCLENNLVNGVTIYSGEGKSRSFNIMEEQGNFPKNKPVNKFDRRYSLC